MFELLEKLRGFRRFLEYGRKTVHGSKGGVALSGYTCLNTFSSAVHQNSQRKKMTLKGFQRKKEDAIDSLMTGFTYGSQRNHGNVLVEETSSIYPPAVNLNGYAEPILNPIRSVL